jgi:uncharacterized protein affecting Mg2+/Co2+ transport
VVGETLIEPGETFEYQTCRSTAMGVMEGYYVMQRPPPASASRHASTRSPSPPRER